MAANVGMPMLYKMPLGTSAVTLHVVDIEMATCSLVLQLQHKLPLARWGLNSHDRGTKTIHVVRATRVRAGIGCMRLEAPRLHAFLKHTVHVPAQSHLQAAKVRGVHILLAETRLSEVDEIRLLLLRRVAAVVAVHRHRCMTSIGGPRF